MISILDYGSGNIRSAERALQRIGLKTQITSNFQEALEADGLVVPGVGAFGSCMQQLQQIGAAELIRQRVEQDRPILGICVGMQILFEGSEESPDSGVGIFTGKIKRLDAPILPHIGWNEVNSSAPMDLLDGLLGERFYFVHSFALPKTASNSDQFKSAESEYGEKFVAALQNGPVSAVQFHPEKSGDVGMALLKNWSRSI